MMEPEFGLYLHWPFCAAKCPYCDFNSHVRARVDESEWRAAFVSEIQRVRSETGPRVLKSIFLGGGTPSLMSADLVDAILSETRQAWAWANDIEITLEANPTSIESGRFAGYRLAGVNRVSLGVQALNERDLRRLGRLHSVDDAMRGLEVARQVFDRVSFDLIYARQDQTLAAWREELRRALAFEPDHVSLYQLTIEPETAFGQRHAVGGLKGLPDEDLAADLFEATQAMCEEAGLPAYETSNHARTGFEANHNMLYWRQQDWAGIGPGAHGRLTRNGSRWATETYLGPEEWLSFVNSSGSGESQRARVSADDQIGELLLLGLRITNGVDLRHLESLGWNRQQPKVQELISDGFLEIAADKLKATPKGRPVLNAIISALL